MAEDDIHVGRQGEFAEGIRGANRDAQVKFHLDLAGRSGSGPISQFTRAREAADTTLAATERLLELKLVEYKHDYLTIQEPERMDRMITLIMAMFLTERTREIGEAALKLDNLGAYSLYAVLRQQVNSLLVSSYYTGKSNEPMTAYLDIEPLLIAASQLCRLPAPPTPEEMGVTYQKKLVEILGKP